MFLYSMSISADFLAMAKIGVKLNEIPEGKSASLKWRNKPLFIRHCVCKLSNGKSDDINVEKLKWLVVIGLCNNLGNVATHDFEDFGDYYCPCHGFHYDASGCISKAPERFNLNGLLHKFFKP